MIFAVCCAASKVSWQMKGKSFHSRSTTKRRYIRPLRFPGLLFELGLSPMQNEALSVKIEIDTRPPVGATLTTSAVRFHVKLHLQHHDRASLLAGKLHALLVRGFTKGRDITAS